MSDPNYLVIGRCGGTREGGRRCRRPVLRAWRLNDGTLMISVLRPVLGESGPSYAWSEPMSEVQARAPRVRRFSPNASVTVPSPGFRAQCSHCTGFRVFVPDAVVDAAWRAAASNTGKPVDLVGFGTVDWGYPVARSAQRK